MPSMPHSLVLAIILLAAFAHISALAAPMPLPSSRATPCPELITTSRSITTITTTTTTGTMLPTTTTTTAILLQTYDHTTPHDELKMKRNQRMVDLIHSDGSVTTTLLDFPAMRESRNESGSESGSGMEEKAIITLPKNGSIDRSGKTDMEKESKTRVSVVNGIHGNDTTTTHHRILPSFLDENKNETEKESLNATEMLPTHHHAPLPKYNTSSPFQNRVPAVLGSDNDTSTTLPTHHHKFPILPRAGDGKGNEGDDDETPTAMLREKHQLPPIEATVADGRLLIPDIGDRDEGEEVVD